MKIDSFQAKGRRPYMEDFMLTTDINRGTLLGVFDGHGGFETAEWLYEHTEEYFVETLGNVGDPQESLRYTVQRLAKDTNNNPDGSTLSLAFIPNYTGKTEVYTAQIGDSPIIVKAKGGILDYGSDHNVRSNYIEADRVSARGGFVSRGYAFATYSGPGLQMSRALGDVELAAILSREPDLRYFELEDESFILMASDGLFTGHTKSDIDIPVGLMTNVPTTTAEDLVKIALAIPTNDNVTAIIVRF